MEGNNDPIIGATIMVKGTSVGTITDIDGNFRVTNIPDGAKAIEVSYIGMLPQSMPIQAAPYKILLKEDTQVLEEVIIQGAYGAQTKASVTGAISSVDSKKIEQRPVSSAASALEGTASGIQVNSSYGEPGTDATIRIRGFGSVNGSNAPLYVVDGVAYQGNLSDINPSDIESMSVLKDAASAALYGNKAANGVIIITTKKGKGDKLSFGLSMNQGIYTRGMPEYSTLGDRQWMETMWDGQRNSILGTDKYPTLEEANAGATSSLVSSIIGYNIYDKPSDQLFDTNGRLRADAQIQPGYKGDFDWFKPIERVGHRQEYNLNGGAASEKANYFFSVGYLDEKGYLKTSDFQRLSARTNININPTPWLKTGLILSATHQRKNITTGDAESNKSYVNPFYFARNMAPIYPVHLHDAKTGEYVLDEFGNKIYDKGTSSQRKRPQNNARHVVWESELDKKESFRNTINGQLYADIKFLKDFTFTVRGAINLYNNEEKGYNNAIIGDGAGLGRANKEVIRSKEYTFQQQLDWNRLLGNAHHLNIMVAHENFKNAYEYMYGFKAIETIPGNDAFNNFTQMNTLSGYPQDYRTESYLSRIRYNYDQKYYGELSFRRDGSSKFHEDNRWGNFWSVGGSWMISEEEFMEPLKDYISDLKFRASYGEVGNDASVSRYGHLPLYTLQQNHNLGAVYKSQFESKEIKWETTQSIGIALEGRLWNRLNLSIEYFDKRSKDLLFYVSKPLSVGSTETSEHSASKLENIGTVSNRGFEINADIDIIKNKDWTWNVGTNGTYIKNEVIKLPESNRKEGILNGSKKIMEGHSIYEFWTYKYQGVDQMNGNALYLINSDKYYIDPDNAGPGKQRLGKSQGVVINGEEYAYMTSYAKRDWSGSAIPKWYGSFDTSLRWKDLTFSALFTYSIGGKILDFNYNNLMSVTANPAAIHKDALKAWSGIPEGMTEDNPHRLLKGGTPKNDYKRSKDNNAVSDRFLHNASYLTIKNIAMSYSLPRTFVEKLSLSSVNVNMALENLWTFTSLKGMNPQQSFGGTNYNAFVTARVFTVGLNVKF